MLDFFDRSAGAEGNQKNLTINFGATYLFHFTKIIRRKLENVK